jgi:hypothetical protein
MVRSTCCVWFLHNIAHTQICVSILIIPLNKLLVASFQACFIVKKFIDIFCSMEMILFYSCIYTYYLPENWQENRSSYLTKYLCPENCIFLPATWQIVDGTYGMLHLFIRTKNAESILWSGAPHCLGAYSSVTRHHHVHELCQSYFHCRANQAEVRMILYFMWCKRAVVSDGVTQPGFLFHTKEQNKLSFQIEAHSLPVTYTFVLNPIGGCKHGFK